jgi:hypothetical protein
MKWLQGNPLGIVLAATGGFLALLVLGMAIVWSLPVTGDADDTVTDIAAADMTPLVAEEAGSLDDYRIVDQRPVFNESRQPEVVEVENVIEDPTDVSITVKDAPEVKLTGVIIAPGIKIASLTPVDTTQESVMAHEGQSLTGEFVGWQVSIVNPRDVVLKSNDGQQLELELQVHDVAIKEPPKPKPAVQAAQAKQTEPGQPGSRPDDEPLSRAEQIRQRIAERREELRREQDAQASQNNDGASRPKPADNSNAYQNAIQARIRNVSKGKDKDNNDDKDG